MKATYQAAHLAVKAARGPARDHPCWNCGRPAAHWAYDHRVGAALVDEFGRKFSVNIEHYKPMCQVCHVNFDLPPEHYFVLATVINAPCSYCGAAAGQLCRRTSGRDVWRAYHEGPLWQHAPRRNRPEAWPLLVDGLLAMGRLSAARLETIELRSRRPTHYGARMTEPDPARCER